MARRRINPRRVKIHRSYTVGEAALVLSLHENTIRAWIKQGLPTIDNRKPTLIHGGDLRQFIEAQRRRAKRPCPPGHLFCLRCREPRRPAQDMVDYLPITPTSGNLRGICPDCETFMHRRTALAQLDEFSLILEIAFPERHQRIRDRSSPSVNCDSSKDSEVHDDTQRRE